MLARMTTSEQTPTQSADEPSSAASEAIVAADSSDTPAVEPDPADALSPAVRRLVRQYDLDITGIHGTGPDGRIRVGDVIGVLGSRAEQAVRGPAAPRAAIVEDDTGGDELRDAPDEPDTTAPQADTSSTTAAVAAATVTTTVFECDLSRVLAHRKKLRGDDIDVLLTSYFLLACADALAVAPELTAGGAARFGVHLTTADGHSHRLRLDATGVTGARTEQLRASDAALRASVGADLADANLHVYHYGASGSLIATPTPIDAGQAASLGIGRVRREIVIRNVDGDDTPRVAMRCHVSLSFAPERVTLTRANQFLAHAVRVLELWPD
jgi:2-oxoglutarate dehydrogenase E2 component (dihydrolipoamide succinyltransferase)